MAVSEAVPRTVSMVGLKSQIPVGLRMAGGGGQTIPLRVAAMKEGQRVAGWGELLF